MIRRLSRPLADIGDHYDAIVIGSGYGGGVAASRLSRMGLKVAVLERGEERLPGEFPDTVIKAAANLQTRGAIRTGSATALFDLHIEDDMNVLVGCGLGGTSLINANVSLTADPRVFDDPAWPAGLQDDDLVTGYERAQAMLSPVPYPSGNPDFPPLNKLEALTQSGQRIGTPAYCPPINVTFENRTNSAGVKQPKCTLCGDCCSGCNVGSKNTTQMNYLPDAAAFGAEIYCGARVLFIERKPGGGWLVHYQPQGKGREKFGAPPLTVSANKVVVAAGTLGSTEILLRSKEQGLPLSNQLGKRFSGNGDVLAFGYNNDAPIDGIGMGHKSPTYNWRTDEKRPVGPTITGIIDLRSGPLEDGMVIEEGAIPGGIGALLPAVFAAGSKLLGHDTDEGDSAAELREEAESLLLGPYHGAINRTQTFLVMSHDGADGEIVLEGDGARVKWPGIGARPHFEAVATKLREAVAANGGTYVPNPIWTKLMDHALVTVHPLGGCAMGDNAAGAVVDGECRVFSGTSGNAVHEGLFVCDGSIMPRSLGVNPLLTITALSERAMIKLAKAEGRTISKDGVPPQPEPEPEAHVAGIRFTERMAGTIHPAGGGGESEAAFVVTVESDDVKKLIEEKEHIARLSGTVSLKAISAEPLTIEQGHWNLFMNATDRVDTREMTYFAPLTAEDGSEWLLTGRKLVHNDQGFDLWRDTTTLFIEVYRGRAASGTPAFTGELHIAPADFARQMGTMAVTGQVSAAAKAEALARFGAFFAGSLFDVFGGPLVRPSLYDPSVKRPVRPLRVLPPEIHFFDTDDGRKLRFLRYRGGPKGPLIMAHGLGVSSKIFSIDTIDTNMLEYLYAGGFDCWLLDFRASIDLSYVREQFTADDVARKDYPAAVAYVRAQTGAASVQFLGHCYGAMSLAMAMLAGLEGVRSVVISQIAAHADVPLLPQRLLAHLRAPDLMKLVGVKWLDACATVNRDTLSAAIDTGLAFLYPFRADNRTKSATSRRITALYGQLYQLDQLNQATLDALPEMFGISNIHAFQQLAAITRKGHVVSADGTDSYLTGANLRNFAVPTLFVHGALNRAFEPTGTRKTMAALAAANGASLYERVEIPQTGHIDCIFGKNAARDVYPYILLHLQKTALP